MADMAERVALMIQEHADELGIMHVRVDGDRVHAYRIWSGPGVTGERELAFTVIID